MTRRQVLLALGAGALAVSLPAAAQQPSYRIALLSYGRSMGGSLALEAFRGGLRDLGYVEGHNLSFMERRSEVDNEQAAQLAAELVRSKPDVIVALAAGVYPVLRAAGRIPIVFAFSGDPVVGKLVDSFARPGRNLTGMSFLSLELVGKRMELIREALPGLKRVAVIANPQHPGLQAELSASQAAAKALGVAIEYFEIRGAPELEAALAGVLKSRSEAIVVFPDSRTMGYSATIAAFAVKNRIPAISGWAHFAEQGNLMAYGPHFQDSFRHLATYVDKVLKGAKPADLPVELPSKLELVVNMKTARALGIRMPQSILLRTDRVIE